MADHWLDIMPAIPLARGVPLVHTHVAGPPVTRGWVALGSDTCTLPSEVPACTYLGWANTVDSGFMRVDLDDPQGFAYALRWIRCSDGWARSLGALSGSLVDRHMAGGTTDADRLALAKACAEVANG